MSKSFADLAAEMKHVVLANIRSGAIKPTDPTAHAKEFAEHRRESISKAQAIRLRRKTGMGASKYYANQHE